MNRIVSTIASIAMVQPATFTTAMTSETTIATATGINSHDDKGIESHFTGNTNNSGSGVQMEGIGNWMQEYEKFFNDENNFDYQGFLKNLKTDELTDFRNYVSSTVVLE